MRYPLYSAYPPEADAALDELKTRYAKEWSYGIAYVYCMRDDTEQCIEWLEKVVEYNDRGSFTDMRSDPWVRRISDEPRVQAVPEYVGLSDAQVAAIEFKVELPE